MFGLLNVTFLFLAPKGIRNNKTKDKLYLTKITQKHGEGFSNKGQTNKDRIR